MNKLRWSDTDCTVGWTDVHGRFCYDDLLYIASINANIRVVPTFNGMSRSMRPGMSSLDHALAYMKHLGDAERGFYIHFKEDSKKGQALLTAFLFKGMRTPHGFHFTNGNKLIRGERPEERV